MAVNSDSNIEGMSKSSILPVLLLTCWVVNASAEVATNTFTYTGSYQTFLVPENVTSISFTLIGASGGSAYGHEPASYTVSGGYGERVTGKLSVLPGQKLYVFVGGYGSDSTLQSLSPVLGGFNGGGAGLAQSAGGGGGATDVRLGSIDLINRIAVAAGGGGANSIAGYGGGPGGVIESVNGWGLNGVLGQGSHGNGGGGGGGYYGGVGGVYGYSRTSGAGGSSWGDSNLVSDLAFSQESSPAFTQVMGFASISYTIPEPSSDTDDDGLSNTQEEQIGTNPNNPDTDGDGLKDGAEYLLADLGFDPKVATPVLAASLFDNPNNAFFYTQDQYNTHGVSSFATGRTNGRADVTDSPASYGLYTQAQRNSHGASRFSEGQSSVTTNPFAYNLYTQQQYDAFGALRFSMGQASVTMNPNAFNLFTPQQYNAKGKPKKKRK